MTCVFTANTETSDEANTVFVAYASLYALAQRQRTIYNVQAYK